MTTTETDVQRMIASWLWMSNHNGRMLNRDDLITSDTGLEFVSKDGETFWITIKHL